MFQWTPGRASPHPPGGRPTARFRERVLLWDGGGERSTEEVVELGAAGHPRAVLGDQLAPGPGQPPAEPGRATTAPPLVTTPETRRWPGRPSRSRPTASLSRESARQAVGHWLHHSLLQLRTTRPIGYPIRWFAVLGGRVAHCVGGVGWPHDRCRHTRASSRWRASRWLGWPVCMLTKRTVTPEAGGL
jgi:hypothetical protein